MIKDLSASPPPFPLTHETPVHTQKERVFQEAQTQQGAEQPRKRGAVCISDASSASAGAAAAAGKGVKGKAGDGFLLKPFSGNSRELTSPFAAVATVSSTADSEEADEREEVGVDRQVEQQQQQQQQYREAAAAGGSTQERSSPASGQSADRFSPRGQGVGGDTCCTAAAWGAGESPFQGMMHMSLTSSSSPSNSSKGGDTFMLSANETEEGSMIELPAPPMVPAGVPAPLQGASAQQAQEPGMAAVVVPHSPHVPALGPGDESSSSSAAAAAAAVAAGGEVLERSKKGAPVDPTDLASRLPHSPGMPARSRNVSFAKAMEEAVLRQPFSERNSPISPPAGSSVNRSSQQSSQMGTMGWLSDSPVRKMQQKGMSRHTYAGNPDPLMQEGVATNGKIGRRHSFTVHANHAHIADGLLRGNHSERPLGNLPEGSHANGVGRGFKGLGQSVPQLAALPPIPEPNKVPRRRPSMAEDAAAAVAADARARVVVDSYNAIGPLGVTRGDMHRERVLGMQRHTRNKDVSGIMGVVTTPPAVEGSPSATPHTHGVTQQHQQQQQLQREEAENAKPSIAAQAAAAAGAAAAPAAGATRGQPTVQLQDKEGSKSTASVGIGSAMKLSICEHSSEGQQDLNDQLFRRAQESISSVGGGSFGGVKGWVLPLSPFQMVCGSTDSSESLPVEGGAITQAPDGGKASVELPVLHSSPQGSLRPSPMHKEAPSVPTVRAGHVFFVHIALLL
ncbi:hypothetical protein DUNSADRAFT_16312 [Dunaliella salina]|uniref:Uncharacterized protein n=1 Tax=Dunaliella salina TaxID=3046 RepID=A0ABQ7G3T6_DUNSA|nr:hypothetical protein DUNSADRAFT_16312 [Dunaliella salina]|eukprot:KAF5829273.1 hypothetical protein DUNSADRAFT_16312 [Dunaliella salina]